MFDLESGNPVDAASPPGVFPKYDPFFKRAYIKAFVVKDLCSIGLMFINSFMLFLYYNQISLLPSFTRRVASSIFFDDGLTSMLTLWSGAFLCILWNIFALRVMELLLSNGIIFEDCRSK